MTNWTTTSPAYQAEVARSLDDRQLRNMLRDAEAELAHHGRHSFMGKEAKKKIHAAMSELKSRSLFETREDAK